MSGGRTVRAFRAPAPGGAGRYPAGADRRPLRALARAGALAAALAGALAGCGVEGDPVAPASAAAPPPPGLAVSGEASFGLTGRL